MTDLAMHPVRRDADDELMGFVAPTGDGAWQALTVFHGVLGRSATEAEARALVGRHGLAAMAERWHWYSRETGEWQVVVPLECHPGRVRVALGYYSLPGVPTAVITADDLAAGDQLSLQAPPPGPPAAN